MDVDRNTFLWLSIAQACPLGLPLQLTERQLLFVPSNQSHLKYLKVPQARQGDCVQMVVLLGSDVLMGFLDVTVKKSRV